jgi:hypothetical protein
MSGVDVLGVDFTSAPRPAKPITVARARLCGHALQVERIDALHDFACFEALLRAPGPWIGGFDFPFGLPREAVRDLGWPEDWEALVRHCAALGKDAFRAALDGYRESRPVGARYAHRATDLPAGSHSPLKLVNPPVGLMFLAGAPRLLDADVTLPGIRRGDPIRVAVEAYPRLAALAITAAPYKSDDRAKQTSARRRERARIVAGLANGAALGLRLEASCALLRSLTRDATGDRLDAVLAALQAGWCWRRRARRYGMPRDVDPCEGWIATARPPGRAKRGNAAGAEAGCQHAAGDPPAAITKSAANELRPLMAAPTASAVRAD